MKILSEELNCLCPLSTQCRHYSGGNTTSRAAFILHRPHFSRAWAAAREPAPQAFTISDPLSVRAAPQFPHSIVTLAPNLTRSAAESMCFVDMKG